MCLLVCLSFVWLHSSLCVCMPTSLCVPVCLFPVCLFACMSSVYLLVFLKSRAFCLLLAVFCVCCLPDFCLCLSVCLPVFCNCLSVFCLFACFLYVSLLACLPVCMLSLSLCMCTSCCCPASVPFSPVSVFLCVHLPIWLMHVLVFFFLTCLPAKLIALFPCVYMLVQFACLPCFRT